MKPLLAASCDDLAALRYPLLATPKIDGIRCLMIKGVATARSLKPIPNRFIQSTLRGLDIAYTLEGCDGELISGDTFQQCTGDIMRTDGEPPFRYMIFDHFGNPSASYNSRLREIEKLRGISLRLKILLPVEIRNREQLDAYLEDQLAAGHEGVMVRHPHGPYKFGRSTFKEGTLIKIKPFEDAEATVIGFEERMHNANPATTNELGRTARSSAQAGLVPTGTLGALIVRSDEWGTFNLGTGFDDATRAHIWANRPAHLGKIAKFRYQRIGSADKPRIPVFHGFRDPRDL